MSWDCKLCGQWVKTEEEWKQHVKFHLDKFKHITIILGFVSLIFPISLIYNWDVIIKMLSFMGGVFPFFIILGVYLNNLAQTKRKGWR